MPKRLWALCLWNTHSILSYSSPGRVLNSLPGLWLKGRGERVTPLSSEWDRWRGEEVIYSWEHLLALPCPLKFSFILRGWRTKEIVSPVQERKRDRVVKRPVSCCTSLILVGLFMSMKTWHLSRFSSIPLFVNMKPRNFPGCTLKEHIVGFIRMLYFLADYKTSSKYATWLCPYEVFTIISST